MLFAPSCICGATKSKSNYFGSYTHHPEKNMVWCFFFSLIKLSKNDERWGKISKKATNRVIIICIQRIDKLCLKHHHRCACIMYAYAQCYFAPNELHLIQFNQLMNHFDNLYGDFHDFSTYSIQSLKFNEMDFFYKNKI